MFWQGSLFGAREVGFDARFSDAERRDLSGESWIEIDRAWLEGTDRLLDDLVELLPLRQRTGVRMYDQIVDEPRLSAWWSAASGSPEPLEVLGDMRAVLADRYAEPFDSIGFNLYRHGQDSVAWHADRHATVVTNPVVAIVSLGAPRPFRMRPKGGGASHFWDLGNGDLFVMAGACQHEWEHTVPKVRRTTGPRLSVTFRSW